MTNCHIVNRSGHLRCMIHSNRLMIDFELIYLFQRVVVAIASASEGRL